MRSALAMCALLGPIPLAAAPSAKAVKKAKRYAAKAKRAYKKARWDDAISGFELAHQQDPQPKYLFNIGRAYERKGDLFRAMEHVQTYIRLVKDEEEREDAQELHDILANKLKKTSGRVRIASQPTAATVRLKGPMGELKGTTPMDRWLEAGSWSLEVAKQGLPVRRQELVVEIGGEVALDVDLHDKPKPPPPATPAETVEDPPEAAAESEVASARVEEAPSDPSAQATSGSTWPMVAIGVGVAALAGGAVMGWLASQKEDELDGFRDEPKSGTWEQAQGAHDDAQSRALAANVLYGAGTAAAATGLVLWWTW